MLIFAYQFSLILLAKCTACHVYFFLFWNLPLSCGWRTRYRVNRFLLKIDRFRYTVTANSTLNENWKEYGTNSCGINEKFFCSQKREKGKERKREEKKNCPNPLVVFHTSRTKRIGNECVCPIFFVRLCIHLDNNFVGPERVLSSFPGISKSFRGELSPRP